jgi:type IV secretion system protein VirB10
MHQEDTNPEHDNHQTAQRHMPSMTQSKTHSIGQKAILFIGGLVVLIALIGVNGGFSTDTTAQDSAAHRRKQKITNHLGKAPQIPVIPKTITQPPEEIIRTNQVMPPKPVYPNYRINQEKQTQEQTPEERKIASAVLGYSNQDSKNGSQIPPQSDLNTGFNQETSQNSFSKNLQPTYLEGAKANLIPDRNLFITKGTFIECVLETAMSSDVLGMTSCRITRDVYSTSGKIVLLERGTRIVGQYKGGLQQGQSRLFVLWNRAETPNGVIIDLDSGGTDALGRAGHEGFIDTHFYERFSGAIMLSLIDDIGAYAVGQASDTQNGQIQLGGTVGSAGDATGIALENSINIRPTFYKNQGDPIRIFVARDLDFRGVYDLKPRN